MDKRDGGVLGELHPFMKLLLLGFIVFLSLMVVMFLGSLLLIPFLGDDWLSSILRGFDYGHAENLNILRYMQILSHIGLFIVPSLVFAILVGGRVEKYFNINYRVESNFFILGVLVIIAAVPLINFLIELNMRMTLPESLQHLEEWMDQAEDSAAELTELFLNVETLPALFFNIFMIAVIPALGEEFMFRGIVLRIFGQWSKNIHIAVWVSAILFSAMHLQFYGFLPRLFLGAILGYLFVWGGSIWLPVLAHFVNNAMAVTAHYLAHNDYVSVDYEQMGEETISLAYIILSIIIVAVILFIFYMRNRQKAAPD